MARPASQQNAGYFPTPNMHWWNIISLFLAHADARGLDPFAGSDDTENGGHFFRAFTEALPMEAYVNELQRERADSLIPLFGKKHVACGGAEELFAPHEFVSFLFLNPPYDYDKGGDGRLELNLMTEAWKWLQPGGIAAIVIYTHHLTDKAVAWIATRMEGVKAFGLPGKHLGEYDQIIIAGIKSDGKRTKDDKNATAEDLKVQRANMPLLDAPLAQPLFKIPAAVMPSDAVYFRSKEVDPEQVMAALQVSGNTQGTSFRDLIWQSDGDKETSSVHELRHRHLAVAVGSGAVDNIVVQTEEHGRATIRAIKKMVKTCFYTAYDSKGSITMQKFRHAVEVTFGLLNEVGDVIELEGDKEVLPFIAANATAMKERIDAAVEPLYKWDFAGRRRELLDVRLGEEAEFELFHAQRHMIGMAIEGLKHKRGVLMCASMGVGKTSAASTAAMQIVAHVDSGMSRDKITVIVYPPQLPEKWLRELEWQSRTGEKIMPRRADHLDELKEALAEMEGVTAPKFILVKRDMMSLGGGVVGAVVWRESLTGKQGDADRKRFVYPTCPECGARLADDHGEDLEADYFDSGKRECDNCLAPLWVKERRSTKLEKQQKRTKYEILGELLGHQYPVMTFPDLTHRFPEPGMYICDGHYGDRMDKSIVRLMGDKLGLLVWDEIHEAKSYDSGRGEAFLRTANAAQKILVLTGTPVNGYASSTYNVEYAINPLMHTAYPRGGSVRMERKDRTGAALVGAAISRDGELTRTPRVEKWTGVNELFDSSRIVFPQSMRRWIDTMGVRISVEIIGKDKKKATGSNTGTSKKEDVTPPEGPGVTADLIMWMAKHTINFYLHDLGSVLPEMDEQIFGMGLPPEVQATYSDFEAQVQNYIDLHKDMKTPRWASVASQLTNWSFCWPNDPRRSWEIWHEYTHPLFKTKVKTLVATCPGFPELELTPKEEWLLDDMRKELATTEMIDGKEVVGRPYIVYVQQSGKTDIQPHLMNLIKKYVPDAKPFLLRSSVIPEKREAVINNAVKLGHNVLVCNARLVETGLDLVQFRTISVYEIIYNLTTLIQSTNRCYRLSQKSPLCRINHLYFKGTSENKAIQLMSTKKRAHSALTGLAMIGLDNLTKEEGDTFNLEEEIAKAYATGIMEDTSDYTTDAMRRVNAMDAQFMNRYPELSLPMPDVEIVAARVVEVVYAIPAVVEEAAAPTAPSENEETLRIVRRAIAALQKRMEAEAKPLPDPAAPSMPGRDWSTLSMGL